MKQFAKVIFATMIGTFLALGLLFVVTLGSFAALSGGSGGDWEADLGQLKDNSTLRIVFNGPLKDHLQRKDLVSSILNYDDPPSTGLYEISKVLQEAAGDDQVKGLFLHFKNFSSGLANAQALRREVTRFKASGKFIIAYAEAYSEMSYMVASAADEVVLYPKGFFEWDGLYSKRSYLKNTLKKIDVVPQIFRVGKYKSAIEPFITDKMSEASREQLSAILEGAWDQLLSYTSEKTKLDENTLNGLAEEMSVVFAKDAFAKGFVNFLGSYEEVEEKLKELSGAEEKPHFASWRLYYKTKVKVKEEDSDNKVAIVFASGAITTNPGDGEGISSESLGKLINDIRRDEDVKAVVFRVNSPGGSALASDVIWTATQWLKDSKAVVTSFGNVAASGGYYMSAGSQYIFAEPTTITGSIGVFGLKLATKKMWNDHIGVTFDTEKTHQYSDMESLVREMTTVEFAKMQAVVDEIYEDFLGVVQKGRQSLKTRDDVHAIAQGRVWIGKQAKEIGLVDELGGLDAAVKKAAELAKLTDYSVSVYPKEKSAIEEFFKQFGEMSVLAWQSLLPDAFKSLIKAEELPIHERVKARLPYEFNIQ